MADPNNDEREGRSDQDYEDYGMRGSEEGSAPQQGEFDSGEAEDEVQNEMSDVVDEDYEEEELDGDEDEDDEPEPMWHYVEKGQKTGPVPESDLRQMVWAGKIGNTLVWTPGQKEWQQLSDFPQLLPTRAGGCKKRKRNPTHTVPPEAIHWLRSFGEETLCKLWMLALRVEELLEGHAAARDKMLLLYIERDPELEGDPEDFALSDEFFWDIIEVQGPEQSWKMIYPGCEEAGLELLLHAAERDESIFRQIWNMHRISEVRDVITDNNKDALEAILAKDPEVVGLTGPSGKTPLFLAVELSKIDIMRAIVHSNMERRNKEQEEYLDLDDMDAKGNTPLHIAAEQGSVEMATLLLDYGANPNIRNECGEYGDGNWSVKLGNAGELRPVSHADKSPLHIACESDDVEMVELLLERGADPDLEDRASMTALHYAVEEGNEELLALLLKADANPALGNNAIGMDNTPFHHAISRGRYGMAKMLLDTGKFDVNKPGAGWLPLHLAARRGSVKIVEMLLEAGADPTAVDENGRTARTLAEVNKRAECVDILGKRETGDDK